MMRTRCCLVIATVLSFACVARAETRWTRLSSEHFVFIGDASEPQIRDIAAHLEQFRTALSRVLPAAALSNAIPTTVFVFQSDAALTPYKPLFEGKPVAVAGFFSGWPDRSVIAINAAAEQTALRVVFHEYAHFLIQNTSGRLPPWVNEGLAGFYETFEARGDGKGALIGTPNEEYVALLKTSRPLPLGQLLAIDYSSPEYNEGSRRGVFYAESWALMHYLQLGSQTRAAQFVQFLARLHEGGDPKETFTEAFGDTSHLERELREYVRRFNFPALRVDFESKVTEANLGAPDTLNDVDSTTYLADLLARTGHVDEARSRLRKVLDAHPAASQASEALGTLELNAGNADAALPWLERAAQAPTNADADTLAIIGRAESLAGQDRAKALALLERAVALAPGREEYRLMLAEELVRQRQYDRATELLGALTTSARRAEIRNAARDALTWVATHDNDSADGKSPAQPAQSVTAVRPTFRIPRPDELRVVGMLASVECDGGRVVIHVDTDDESLRLSTPGLNDFQWASYGAPTPTSLACGQLSAPPRVFATYRESDSATQAAGIDGQVVSIEVLPAGYVDR